MKNSKQKKRPQHYLLSSYPLVPWKRSVSRTLKRVTSLGESERESSSWQIIFKSRAGHTAPECTHRESPSQPDPEDPALLYVSLERSFEQKPPRTLCFRSTGEACSGREGGLLCGHYSTSTVLPWNRQITSQELASFLNHYFKPFSVKFFKDFIRYVAIVFYSLWHFTLLRCRMKTCY